VGIERRKFLFMTLGRSLSDSTSMLLSMLAGTNLAHYAVTSIVTYVLLDKFAGEHIAEIVATVITAPMLLVFSELIPKSLFYYRANALMPPVSPVLFISNKIFVWCGLVPLMKLLAGAFTKVTNLTAPSGAAISAVFQPHIKALIQDSQEEGLLSSVQTDIINRLSTVSHLDVTAAMTSVGKTQMVEVNSDKSVLLAKLKESPFTRLPVYEQSPANIIGYVNIYECLNSPQDFTDLRSFIKPLRKLPANTTVIDAINIIRRENQKIVLVTKSGLATGEKVAGILTMKDLIEELVGELAEW
jgi:CBS domain containing-hemolysin-like protein